MKKLIYLIVVIVGLGLIVAGCIPTVPPAEQDELSTLIKSEPIPYVAPTAYGSCDDLGLTITGIKFVGDIAHPSVWDWDFFNTGIDHTVTTVGILYRSEVGRYQGILNAPITLTITDSDGIVWVQETKLSSCMGYSVSLWDGWIHVKYNGFTFETDVCGWPVGHYSAELTAQVGEYTTSYSSWHMEFEITQEDIDGFDCPSLIIEVEIDIKPGSDPNSINLGSKGVVPVAVLTTDDFDASTVDPDTVEFAGASLVRWTLEDVDGDGDFDMLFHFKTQELELDKDSTNATLTGETGDGIPVQGTDTVNIVPKK